MKAIPNLIITFLSFGLFTLVISGCYTERATNGDDQRWYRSRPTDRQEVSYQETKEVSDSTESIQIDDNNMTNNGYYTDDPWSLNYHSGFSYYYPPYYSYWPWDSFNSYYYPGYYYRPYCYAPYGYGYDYSVSPLQRAPRSFGANRGINGRAGTMSSNHRSPSSPTTADINKLGRHRASSSKVNRTAPRSNRQLNYAPHGNTRTDRGSFARQQTQPSRRTSAPSSYGSSRPNGGNRSFSPSAPSRPSAPSGGGSRGGSSRGTGGGSRGGRR